MHTIDSVFLAHWAVSSAFGTVEGTNGVERQAASAADGEVIRKSYSMLLETVERVQREDRISIEIIAEHSWAQNPYQESGVELAREVAAELGLTHDRVLTVAGHDSTNMKDEVPTVMLFVPSVDGVSHNLQ